MLSAGFKFLSLAIRVASLRLTYEARDQASRRLDTIAFVVLGAAYILVNVGLVV